MAKPKRTPRERGRAEARMILRKWAAGEIADPPMSSRDKVPADVAECRSILRGLVSEYARRAGDAAGRLVRIRLNGLAEAMPCVPRGTADPDAWRASAHRDLILHYWLVVYSARAYRSILRKLPAPKPAAPSTLF